MPRSLQYNGRMIDYDYFSQITFEVENIVQSAAKVCRFNGHTKFHYSNLRHMYMVCKVCPHADLKLACLLHDVHEIVIGDLVTPFIAYLGEDFKEQLDDIKFELDEIVAKQFDCPELVDHDCRKVIKYYDQQMTNVEASFLINNYWSLFEEPEIIVDYLKYESNGRTIHNWRSELRYLMSKREAILI